MSVAADRRLITDRSLRPLYTPASYVPGPGLWRATGKMELVKIVYLDHEVQFMGVDLQVARSCLE